MRVIDCQSYETALLSLANVYGVPAAEIEDFLFVFEINEEYSEELQRTVKSGDVVRTIFEMEFNGPKRKVLDVSWFHLTRTLDGTSFSDGILPLGSALPKIWDMLISIVNEANKQRLEELRINGVPNELYILKTPQKSLHGPYAMLIRESAFNSRVMCNHDYLGIPEIIDDICRGYSDQFGGNIQLEIEAALRPCIVKFDKRSHTRDVIAPILNYCLCKARNQPMHLYANSCFDGKGKAVPFKSIRSVEYL